MELEVTERFRIAEWPAPSRKACRRGTWPVPASRKTCRSGAQPAAVSRARRAGLRRRVTVVQRDYSARRNAALWSRSALTVTWTGPARVADRPGRYPTSARERGVRGEGETDA